MNKTIKIAIHSGRVPSTTFIERLILGLAKSGCQIYLFGLQDKPVHYGTNIISFAFKNSKLHKAWNLLKYSVLLTCFKRKDKLKLDGILKSKSQHSFYDKMKCYQVLWHKPNVFHVQWAKDLAYWSWVQEFNMKLVLSLRGAHINYSPIADPNLAESYRQIFPQVDRFHAVSKAIGAEAQKYGAPASKIDVVYSGLNLNDFPIAKKTNESKVLNIISIGRSHWKKGYHYALDACKLLKDKNVAFTYTIIGAKDYLELMYQVKDLALEHHVILADRLPIDQVLGSLNSADVLLLPSVEEGIANVVLEAMALKTLVLTTDCGGMNEVIQNGINGFVCPVRDANGIAEGILKILKLDPIEHQLLLDRAFDTIQNQHTEDQMIQQMLHLYDHTLKTSAS